jgi:hypothetical protein
MKENDAGHPNQISLTFIVNGTETKIDKVNINEPLHVAVQRALDQTGNSGRPIGDWQVIYNDQTLDINRKIVEYNLPDGAIIFLSLKAGQGGI